MNHDELERAWPAAEPAPGFADRVLERMQREPARSAPSVPRLVPASRRVGAALWGWPKMPRALWLGLPVSALALVGALLLQPTGPARPGEVIAAEPRVVAIGERAVAELSSGARLRWSGDEVQQDSGAVTYRVRPGASFAVHTPHGSVTVLGTVFRVVVTGAERAGGEPMKKERWVAAGAATALGALLWVSVESGSVRLLRGQEELVLGMGQAGSISADGALRLEPAEAPAPAEPEQPGAHARDERARARQVADAVRRHAARQRESARAASVAKTGPAEAAGATSAEPAAPPVEFMLPSPSGTRPPAPELTEEQARRREYLRRTIAEQYIPVARDCYGELLERQPKAGGKVVLEFAIVGDGDAGVVDRVALRDEESTLDDPEFVLCMRESMYTAVFEPPPPGASETTVVYPVELRPE